MSSVGGGGAPSLATAVDGALAAEIFDVAGAVEDPTLRADVPRRRGDGTLLTQRVRRDVNGAAISSHFFLSDGSEWNPLAPGAG